MNENMLPPTWLKVILTIISIAIMLGNGTVFFIYYHNRRIRTTTNLFVLSLAVSDFLIGSILLPMRTWYPNPDIWGLLVAFTLIASLSNICSCTYDRHVAIHQPLRYNSIVTTSKARKVIIAVWVIPTLVALIPRIWANFDLGMNKAQTAMAFRIYTGLMSFSILATCLVLSCLYVSIYVIAKRHFHAIAYLQSFAPGGDRESGAHIKSRRFSVKSLVKDVKATKLVAMIAATFVLCWLPLIIINIMESLGYGHEVSQDFSDAALFTIFLNSLMNPVIYAFFQKDFRKTISSYLRRLFKRTEIRKEVEQAKAAYRKTSYTSALLYKVSIADEPAEIIDQNENGDVKCDNSLKVPEDETGPQNGQKQTVISIVTLNHNSTSL